MVDWEVYWGTLFEYIKGEDWDRIVVFCCCSLLLLSAVAVVE